MNRLNIILNYTLWPKGPKNTTTNITTKKSHTQSLNYFYLYIVLKVKNKFVIIENKLKLLNITLKTFIESYRKLYKSFIFSIHTSFNYCYVLNVYYCILLREMWTKVSEIWFVSKVYNSKMLQKYDILQIQLFCLKIIDYKVFGSQRRIKHVKYVRKNCQQLYCFFFSLFWWRRKTFKC